MEGQLTHNCELQTFKTCDFSTRSPYATRLNRLCSYWRKITTVSMDNVARNEFKSTAQMRKELRKHLSVRKYSGMIHPLSKFLIWRRLAMFFVYFLVLLVEPFKGTFLIIDFHRFGEKYLSVRVMSAIINLCIIADMVVKCFIGYVVPHTGRVVLDQAKVMKQYLRGYFALDAIPCATSVLLLIFDDLPLKYYSMIHVLLYLRIVRIPTMSWNLNFVLKRFGCGQATRRLVVFAVVSVLLIHWWCCVLFSVVYVQLTFQVTIDEPFIDDVVYQLVITSGNSEAAYDNLTTLNVYLCYIQTVLSHFYGAGVGPYRIRNEYEQFLCSLILITGLIFNTLMIAYVLQVVDIVNISGEKFEEFLYEANLYMNRNGFTPSLRRRIRKYYDVRFQHKFFSEQKINDTLSEHLRMEVLLHSCQNLISQTPIFKGLSKGAVGSMLAVLQQEIYLPRDLILDSWKDKEKLYFVMYGSCLLRAESGQEACHFEDGEHFGEVTLRSKHQPIPIRFRIFALETTEIYSIYEHDLRFCSENYPEIAKKFFILDKARMNYYAAIMATSVDRSDFDPNDVLGELRRGRIISRGLERDRFGDLD